ncbi:MAG: hypothetical protein QHJ82_11920, partial [Verrucomicrobiota bacterium]|nr:hypothetical protein [Verrucomicrobiota bacterium]
MPCDSVAGKSALIKPPLHAALPQMQWALADAKRLECGSLLPLCFLCANNVSVPMSAFEGFLRRLRQLRIG